MVRKLEVVVPEKHFDEIRDILTLNRSVHHLSFRKCRTTDHFNNELFIESVAFTFMVVNKKTHELIDLLTMYGVSSRFGSIDVTALTSSKPRVSTIKEKVGSEDAFTVGTDSTTGKKRKRKYRVSDRLAYDEVYDTIDGQLHLTFDYLALIAVGAVIAAIGLLTDSSVAVVASMLVSPLMGPIVGMTFGFIIKDNDMFYKSIRNETIGVLVCFLTGAIMGFITAPIMDDPTSDQLAFGINTQISSRGVWSALLWGAGVAAPSGVGVALGVSSDQVSALIGVAISAALLPPITNSGLCLATALVFEINSEYTNAKGEWLGNMVDVSWHWFEVGYISMLLFLLNWLLIFIFGIMTFRLKKLHESANNERRLINLNKFYELKDKAQEQHNYESSSYLTGERKPKLSLHTSLKPETLNTPLLTGSTGANYSDTDNMAIKMQHVVSMPVGSTTNLLESMDGASTISGISDGMSANGSKDTPPMRNNRGMSTSAVPSSRNILEEMDALQTGALSMKRKVKRMSMDDTKGILSMSKGTSRDDMV